MAVRSAISIGFPSPNYVVELGQRETALPGEFIVEGGQAIVAVTSGQFGSLALAATGAVSVLAAASPAIGNLTLSAIGNVALTATGVFNFARPTLSATATVTDALSLDAPIGEITLEAAGVVVRRGDGVAWPPWWWHAYVARHQAERVAAKEQWRREHAIDADGWAVMPLLLGFGQATHDPDADVVEFLGAILPWLIAA
jgi:hypothetical protein